ncbi:MAG: fructosamine kinase family protein [Gammaproteobacteria bacterium]
MSQLSAALLAAICRETGVRLETKSFRPVGGGDINQAVRCRDERGRDWFLKLNDKTCADMFAAEAAGLVELDNAGIRVPSVAGFGADGPDAWLLLEWLDLKPAADDESLGKALANLHRVTASGFGWKRDNYIGLSEQNNTWTDDWVEFFRHQRLGVQLQLAARNGAPERLVAAGERLQESMDAYFAGHEPPPSLLHGDLWGGNKGTLADGTPVVFDPAVYYGDPEADIAMTRLFGGFSFAFYAAYHAEWPPAPGVVERQELYNLYHVLNHFNLFGGAYQAQAEQMIARLLAGLSG